MIVKTVPQRTDKVLHVTIDVLAETVIARIGEIEDTFDFSQFPDGEIDNIETILPVNPILKAKRENGELYLEVLHWYQDANAPEEVRFPQPQRYTEGVIEIG